MLREDLKAHEIRKRIVAKDCVNTVIIPMVLLREEACVSLKRPFSKVIPVVTKKSDTLKNAIESADYKPDSRDRRHHLLCYLKKVYSFLRGDCGASTMAVFYHARLPFT
jgi:hypothetical protein